MDKSIEGKTPIVFAVASEHVDVYNYLINKKHDSYKLLEDKKVSTLLTSFFWPHLQQVLRYNSSSHYNFNLRIISHH